MKREHWIGGLALSAAVGAAILFAPPKVAAGGGSIEGTVSHPKGKANLVVYVAKATGTFTAPSKPVVVDQKGMKFVPYVTPVLMGTTVDFLNSDTMNHNVFTPDNEGFNLGTFGPGEKRSYAFKKAGNYTLLCSLHPEMEGFVISLENPYFAAVGGDGKFTIPNVPDGSYNLKVWGKKLKKDEKDKQFPVTVAGGKVTTTIEFN